MTYVTNAQVDITTAEADAAAEAALQAKRTLYLTKAEDFWSRAHTRFMTLSEANATWTLSSFSPLVTQACNETVAEMLAEMT